MEMAGLPEVQQTIFVMVLHLCIFAFASDHLATATEGSSVTGCASVFLSREDGTASPCHIALPPFTDSPWVARKIQESREALLHSQLPWPYVLMGLLD